MKRLMRNADLRIGIAMVVAFLTLAPVPAQAAIGDNFSFAPTTANGTDAPAFPGAAAFWAGVCDLDGGAASVGMLPSTAYADCIEMPDTTGMFLRSVRPPVAPGVTANSGPDGWLLDRGLAFLPYEPTTGPAWRVEDVTHAGAHPDGSTSFWFSRNPEELLTVSNPLNTPMVGPDGNPKNITVSLPPGVIGDPNAVPKCAASAAAQVPPPCHPKTQVGVTSIQVGGKTAAFAVYNIEPRRGKTAELLIARVGFTAANNTNVPIVAKARTSGDFGIDAGAIQIPAGLVMPGQSFTIWGVPWAASHDKYRPATPYCGTPISSPSGARESYGMPLTGLPGGSAGPGSVSCSQEPVSYDPSWGPIRPFLTAQTECSSANPVTRIFADNWNTPVTATAESPAPLVTGCGDLEFPLGFGMEATSSAADSPTGLDVDLSVQQHNDPPVSVRHNADDDSGAPSYWKSADGRAVSHLRNSVVTLPYGVSVNPSAATGLAGCSDTQIGLTDRSASPPLFNDDDPLDGSGPVECPAGSVIGTAEVATPLLEEKLSGHVVLGTPETTNPVGEADGRRMFRMFIVLQNRERGLVAKVYGSAVADPATGRITAIFANNPRVPFDDLKLSFKGGDRGLLAMPQRCGSSDWSASFDPWSGGAAVPAGGQFEASSRCSFGFAPTLAAGMDTSVARANGTFSFKFARQDGEQWLRGLTARLPQGLLASVKDVPLCSNAAADAGNCPAGSKIGIVDAKAGSGDPFVLEQKGEVFLTEGYKGGEYGLAVKVRPVAGPFRGAMELSPIVVRQAIHVDRKTAQVTAVSDPFPLVHHGVPLRVREVTVLVDRPGFMLNPSDCAGKQVGADLLSAENAAVSRSNDFHTSECAGLEFEPKLALRLTGRKQVTTGKHPGIRAQVNQQGVPEAGIEKAVVRLPKSLALDVNNAQALCEFVDGTKPDLENHCPKGSIVGRARAVSPLLNDPLVGDVYFVKNVRVDPKTGNQIRTLPMIVVALRGEISVNLRGESDTTKSGRLVNTFDQVPDAPVGQFNLNINGGKTGIIAVTRTRRALINLCARPRSHVAESDMDAQNGRRHDTDVRMATPCTKRQVRHAKQAAKRATAKRARAH